MDTDTPTQEHLDKIQKRISVQNEVDSFYQWLISKGNVTAPTAKCYCSSLKALLNSGKSVDEFLPWLSKYNRKLTSSAWRKWKECKQIVTIDITSYPKSSIPAEGAEVHIPEDVLEIVRMAPPWLSIHRLVDLRWSDTKRWLPNGVDYDGQPHTRPVLHICTSKKGRELSYWAVDLEFDEALCALQSATLDKTTLPIDKSESDYLLGAKYHWGAIKRALVRQP